MNLFDDSSLKGWNTIGDSKWALIDGNLGPVKKFGDTMLVSEAKFSDFELTLEFWIDSTANSGIFIRCQDPNEISPFKCYEVNIWDNHPKQEFRTGAVVFHAAPPIQHVETAGKWNTIKIKAAGTNISVQINGETTALMENDTHRVGDISFQRFNKGEVTFRNILIQTSF